MFYAVRMKEHNPARGCRARNFSGPNGRKWAAGEAEVGKPFRPSRLVIMQESDLEEINYLRTVRQPRSNETMFEVFAVNDKRELAEFVQAEMERRSGDGHPPIRAQVVELGPLPLAAQPEFVPATKQPSAPSGNEPINVEDILAGKNPLEQDEKVEAPVKKVSDMLPADLRPDMKGKEPEVAESDEKAPPTADDPTKADSLAGASAEKDGRLCAFPGCEKRRYPRGEGFCGPHYKQSVEGKIEPAAYYRGK